ncbi:MAG: ABC transporter permease [Capsulimonadaceae bacterium]
MKSISALTSLLDNPVIIKEFRGRMRGPRAFLVILAFLGITSIMLVGEYQGLLNTWRAGADQYQPVSDLGRMFFQMLIGTQYVLIALIVPATTAGTVSMEREQRTFEMVRCTCLNSTSIIIGKLLSSVSFIGLLLVSALPLVCVTFLLGGVAPDEMAAAYGILLCDALLLGTVGIAWSTICGNTGAATGLTYGAIVVILVGEIILSQSFAFNRGLHWTLSALSPGFTSACTAPETYFGITMPAWVPAVLLNGTLALLLGLVSINRIDDDSARRAAGVRAALLAFVIVCAFFLDGSVGMFPTGSPEAIVGIVLLLVFAPALATGTADSDDSDGVLARGICWSPFRALREATLSTAPASVLLFSLVIGAATWVAQSALPTRQSVDPCAAPILISSVALGIAGMGLLVSLLTGNRWHASVITYVFLALASACPTLAVAAYSGPAQVPPGINWIYASPLAAAMMTGPGQPDNWQTYLLFAPLPGWWVTAALYAAAGLVCLIASMLILRVNRRKTVVAPENP